MLYNALRRRANLKLLQKNARKVSILAANTSYHDAESEINPNAVQLDEVQHIVTDGPSKTFTLSDFGYSASALNASDFAFTEPFRLLTPSCIAALKSEIAHHRDTSTYRCPPFAPCVVRGLAHKSAFINDLWSSSAMREVVSKAVGAALEPHPMLYERGHINVQNNQPKLEADEEDQDPVFGWHTDSQPYVCIVMLSDPPPSALGGETYVKKASGEVVKLTFPGAGYAYVLQGSVIEHAAMPARNYKRETMITSFVPSDVKYKDNTNIDLSVKYSPLNETFREFLVHRRDYVGRRLNMLSSEGLDANLETVERIEKAIDDIVEDLANTKRSMEAVRTAINGE